jgi:hypothetical protein
MEWFSSSWVWIALVASVFGGIVFREKTNQSYACLVIGQEIASDEFLEINKKGHQDGLSHPRHTRHFFASLALIVATPIIMFQVLEWGCLWFLLVSLVSMAFYGSVRKSYGPHNYYLPDIYADLVKRKNNYEKEGDTVRSLAASHLARLLEEQYATLKKFNS